MDSRVKKLAKILTEHSIEIKEGDVIVIGAGAEAKDLVLELSRLILKKGAFPRVNIGLEGFSYIYFKTAKEWQLKKFPKITMYETRKSNGRISIGSERNTRELTNINPKNIVLRQKATKPIHDLIIKQNNWVIVEFPTNALAQDADMSLREFENFAYKATNIDWSKESKRQDKIKRILDKGNNVRIIGKNTDLSFSIEGREAIKCDGRRNMPDGEVFMAPVEDSVGGYIEYSYPAIYSNKEVSGIRLEFKEGKVVKASAEKNESILKEAIKTDKGSCKLGEFGIGLNYGIKKFIKQILFDEKIGGTIHLALGMAYPEGGGKNKSAIHWDMIKDLRKDGKIIVDGKVIQENGKWKVKI